MTLGELLNTCRTCGMISEKYYEEITNMPLDFYECYRDIELRKNEIKIIKSLLEFGVNSIGKVMCSLREDLKSVYTSDNEYDSFLDDIIKMNKEYENYRYKDIILNNLIDNSSNFIEIEEKNIEFFRFCDIKYGLKINIDGDINNVYAQTNYNAGFGLEVEMFRLFGKKVIEDVVLVTIRKDKSVGIYKYHEISTKKKLKNTIKKEIEKGLWLGIINDLDKSKELF